jgi:hypothetical protein
MTRTPEPPSRRNPAVRPEIEAIVLHALEKDRAARFQSMAELAQALRNPVGHLQAWRPMPGYNAAALGTAPTMAFDSTPTVSSARQPVATTLSGSSGEYTRSELGAPSGGRSGGGAKLVIGLGLVGLLVGGGVTAWSLKRSPAPAPETAVVTPKPTPEAEKEAVPPPARDEFVSIKITSTPPGAEVVRADGEAAPPTPTTLKVKRGAPTFDVALRLAGYKTVTFHVDTERDGVLDATLPAVEPPPVATTPEPPAKASSSSAKHASKPAKKSGSGKSTPAGKPKTDGSELEIPAWMRK